MNKRLVSIICAAALFTQTLPTNAIATTIEDAFIKKGLNSEVDKDKSDSNSEESSSKDENETSQDNKLKEEELGLDKVKFNAYIDKTDQLLFSIGFDEKEKKFTVSEQSEKNISEETPEETMYTIKIFDKEQKEKFSVELKGKDTGNSEKLEPLKSLNYEVGDFIQITPTDSKDVLKITGNIQGDVDKQKEDYSDGIDNYDYIGNVRFQVEEDHLKTVYNEAPVINGLTDIEESENPMNDILTGISIKDDHDGDIDNSKIVPLITELEGGVLEVSYTVEDSWGRKATGKRKISPKKVEQEEVKQEEPKIIREEIKLRTGSSNSSDSQTTPTGLAANEITVEGTPYFNGQYVRFKIRFDTAAKQIQIVDQDGRKLSNTGDNEYFRFVLYDKDMNEKASVSLLGNDKSDSDKLDKIANQLYEEGDFIGIWHGETKLESETSEEEKNENSPSFVPKLKIGGTVGVLKKGENGQLVNDSAAQTKNYAQGMDKKDISERRFQITSDGLKELINTAPVFETLEAKEIARGGEFDPLDGVKNKINDDFDAFNEDNLDTKIVSITYSSYDTKKVGDQTITYTATDKWGRSSTATRKLTVKSQNPLDTKYIEFKKNNEGNNGTSLFKIKFDPVEKKFLVDDLDAIQDLPIDSSVSSSIFKLKVYTKGGVLQKTLNIKGTDNLKTILKKFDGYTYNVSDRIELWSSNSKSIVIYGVDRDGDKIPEETPSQPSDGNTEQQPNGGSSETPENGVGEQAQESITRAGNTNQSESYQENYEDGIDDSDYMKNVRFEIGNTTLKYIYNKAPEFTIDDNVKLKIDRNGKLGREQLMNGLNVKDDHDNDDELTKNVIIGNIDTTTIGEKEVEYRVIDSWGRSSLIKRKVIVYPLNALEYNYISVKNNETHDPMLTIRLNDETKKFVVDKIDRSKIPSSLSNDTKIFELKLIKGKRDNSSTKTSEENQVGKDEVVEKTITLTKEDLSNESKINEINKTSYQYSDYISLWVYDSEDGISISKKSTSTSKEEILTKSSLKEESSDGILLNGFDNQEQMKNTRFKITSEGIERIYNKAPEIKGLDKKLYIYKHDDITQKIATNGIEIEDDTGKISLESLEITDVDGRKLSPETNDNGDLESKFKFKLKSNNEDDYVKTDEVREFELLYKVTDAWGRSATYKRKVSVISRSVSNDIEFYNEDGSENLFSLKYNPISNIFDVSKKENNPINNGAENNPPSEEQPPQDQSPDESEQSSQGTDSELKAKIGNLSEGNNDTVEDNNPNEGNPDQDDNPSMENPPQEDGNNSQDGEGSGGSSDREDNTEQPKKEIVFKLAIFNVEEKKVGEIELTEEETKNIEELKRKLQDITIYDKYYFSIWSNNVSRIKIQGKVLQNNELGESGQEEQDYSKIITNNDYIDNVRFNLTEDGIHAVYNKAPKINFILRNKDVVTEYAGNSIDYTDNMLIEDDRDGVIDNSNVVIDFGNKDNGDKKTEEDLVIGQNTVSLTVKDSWGKATTIQRTVEILNGIDKNTIIFNGGNGKIIDIGFDHTNKTLKVNKYSNVFGTGTVSEYVKIAVYRPSENGGNPTAIVPEIVIGVSSQITDQILERLKSYRFEYGDYFQIYHGHPALFAITGNVADEREDYNDGVQNPENLLNVKFEITKSGLKSVYTNPDENKVTNNKVVFGPVAPEKFPFKIQIDFIEKKFKVVETTPTQIDYGNSEDTYKIVLIRKDKTNGTVRKIRETTFLGEDEGSTVMKTNQDGNNSNKNWNNQAFEYDDCLYIWHKTPTRSIIKGTIKEKREDYSDGVNDVDNMKNVVFRLTHDGLESVYNNAPEIEGVDDIDVYQDAIFNVGTGVIYTDDYDTEHLTKSVSLKENGMIRTVANTNNNNNGANWVLNTSKLGEKILVYTATDRWGKTTRVERKVTVRPNLYKNVFKVYAESDNTVDDTSSKGISENLADGDSIGEISTPETTPLPNIPQQPSTDDSISNGNNAEDNKPEVDKRKLAFEIGFDTVNNKYKVYNQTNEKLSNNNVDETAFAIQIKSSTGKEKAKIILTGNKRGTAPELLALNNVEYANDDIIRIYRSTLSGIEITGDVTGDIPRMNDVMNDTNKFDYMKNTGFKVSNAGLNAKYNKAPIIDGIKNVRAVSKGTVNLLDGITVSDDIDTNISTNYIYIYIDGKLIGSTDNNNNGQLYSNYNFDEVGTYDIEYKIYDSWNRETIERSTLKVESKVRENEIEVYGPNQQLAFRIIFDANENKFILKGQDNSQNVSKENENIESYSSELNEDNYFQMIVRDARGNEKKKVILTGEFEHDRQQLSELHQFGFNRYDTISLKARTAQAVKIKGDIIVPEVSTKSTTTDYSNGFGTVEKYSEVRFKITDDGLREMTKKPLSINGADPIIIKRGDILDLLEGISVELNDQNNDDYKISVEEISSNGSKTVLLDETNNDNSSDSGVIEDKTKFKKLKEGVYTVRYTATNSWGATTTVDRKITVEPRTDLEAVKLTVKDRDNTDVLVIGFDSIERKLRVLEYKNRSIDYLDAYQVFEINAFDTLGKTLGTITLRGSQQIDQTIIDRINSFHYEEGYSLSVWSKELENRINIEGTIKVDNSSKEESKKIRYKTNLSVEQKKDKMENGRFEILSDGLKYVYNEAPEITDGDEIVPYYKGNLLKAPESLKVKDDHDGEISRTEVTVNDDNVDYDKLGVQPVTYVAEDSWGRRAEKKGQIEIRSAMDSNSINIYPKESSTSNGDNSQGPQEPSTPAPEQGEEQETPEARNGDVENDSDNINQGNDSSGSESNPGEGNESDSITPPENGEGNSGTNSGEGNGSNGNTDSTTPDGGNNNSDNEVVKNSGFSIKFVREGDKNRIKVNTGTKENEQFDSSRPNEKFLTIKIYDVDGTVLKSVDILGRYTGATAKKKIETALKNSNNDNIENPDDSDDTEEESQTRTELDSEVDNSESTDDENSQGGSNSNNDEFEYFNGQYIAIEGVTSETMKSVKIQGTVVNKGNGVSYDTGVNDLDKIQHVRFKFTDLGLEAVYNNAPVVKIDENIMLNGDTKVDGKDNIDGIKGDDFNYLRGIKISDDHDILTKGNVKVTWNPEDSENKEEQLNKNSTKGDTSTKNDEITIEGEQKVGENILLYTVTDSWGRSTTAKRNVKLKNGVFEDNIKFGNSSVDDKLSLIFSKIENEGEEKVQLNLTAKDNDNYFASSNANFDYYKIEVWIPNNISSDNRTNGYTRVENLILRGNQKPQDVSSQIEAFNRLTVPYGTILKIYAGHPQLFSIKGPVRNQLEDYSDNVQNPENLVNTVFKITDQGLKAIYVKPNTDNISENENLISLVAPEKIPLKIKIGNNGTTGGQFSVVDSNATRIDNGVEETVFKLTLKGENGNTKGEVQIRGVEDGNNQRVANDINALSYVYGDTLTIYHKTPKKVLIKGNVINTREDYSDGVDNSLNLTEAVFKLTAKGLEAVYRSAPQIMGIIDMQVEKGEEINYDILKASVSAKDNIDGTINNIRYGDENIDTSRVGMYEFTYTVNNSSNRETTKSSTITVYDRPTINKNNKATIELNSIENTENDIKDYLKTAVDVSDDDDKLYNKTTKVEVKSNDVNPNKAGTYHATYVATDLYGKTTEKKVDIQVVRTINVTVPTKLPFQVVTNLMPDENGNIENNGFVSGVLKLKNNNTSPVKVSVASFGKKADSGELEIVYPESCDWEKMTEEDSMTKMALGLYIKDNSLTESEYNTENKPLWLSTNKQNSDDTANPDSPGDSQEPSSRIGVNEDSNGDKVNEINTKIGVLPAKETGSDKPKEASIGFTSKHGKNFIGGSVTGKFKLIFKFE